MDDELRVPIRLDGASAALLGRTIDRLDRDFGGALLGLLLTGSAGRGTATPHSDLDLVVVLDREEAPPVERSAAIDLIPVTLRGLETLPAFDSPDWYLRWMFAWAPVLLDRTGGRIAAAALRRATLSPAETAAVLVEHGRLDGWINLAYRALKSARAGRDLECRLDAAEWVPWFLEVVFALAGRVRPFNGSLPWELREHPLPGWSPGEPLALATAMLGGDAPSLQAAFRAVERRALAADPDGTFRAVIEDWGDDLALLRR